MKRLVLSLVMLFVAEPSPTAVEQLHSFSHHAYIASQAHDVKMLLQSFLDIRELVHSSQDSMKSVAVTYAKLRDDTQSLNTLEQMADMGIGSGAFQASDLAVFAPMRDMARYRSVAARLQSNAAPVMNLRRVFSLEDPGIVAEDIDYDPRGRSFLITSVLENKILRVGLKGEAVDFAQSPDGWPMFALKIDAGRQLVWATEVAPNHFKAVPENDWGRSALLCFDLRSGVLRSRVEGPRGSALGDLVLTPDGVPIVSDGEGGGIYRLNGGRLERIDHGDFISPQTGTMHPDGKRIFIPDYLRGIAIFDSTSGKVQWLTGFDKHLLSGIDGIYFDHGWLIATQNGTSPERVIRFKLDATLVRVEAEQVIERSSPTLGDPTHGVVVDGKFFYISNSGWDVLDDQGVLTAGAKMTAAHVMSFALR